MHHSPKINVFSSFIIFSRATTNNYFHYHIISQRFSGDFSLENLMDYSKTQNIFTYLFCPNPTKFNMQSNETEKSFKHATTRISLAFVQNKCLFRRQNHIKAMRSNKSCEKIDRNCPLPRVLFKVRLLRTTRGSKPALSEWSSV